MIATAIYSALPPLLLASCSDDAAPSNDNQNTSPAVLGNGSIEGMGECDQGSENSDTPPGSLLDEGACLRLG